MANARERVERKREHRRGFHLSRIETAKQQGPRAALAAAFALFQSEFAHCPDDAAASRIGAKVFQLLITHSAELPRR